LGVLFEFFIAIFQGPETQAVSWLQFTPPPTNLTDQYSPSVANSRLIN